MKKIFKYILMAAIVGFAYNCEEDVTDGSVNYVTFERGPVSFAIAKDATTTRDFKVYAGNKTGSDRTYTVLVNESSTLTPSYSVPGTVTIPANSNEGNLTISVTDDDTLEFVSQTLIVEFQDQAGVSLGDALTINVAEECPGTIITLALSFDDWAEECTWEIYDLSGTPTVIYSGGEAGAYDALDNGSISFDFCLESGNYGIVVYDAYGDGGTVYTVTAGATELASGTVPGGNPANVPTSDSSTFTID